MRQTLIILMLLSVVVPAACSPPPQIVIESNTTRLILATTNTRNYLSTIENLHTGEQLQFSADSADFIVSTDSSEIKASDLKVTDVFSDHRLTYVIMEGEKLTVTQRFETSESGCIKRSLELFAKSKTFIERVSLVDLKLATKLETTINHQARFLALKKGGVFVTVEMPMPCRNISIDREGHLRTVYEPRCELYEGEAYQTAAAVFATWTGGLQDGFDKYRDYTYELSGWREYAIVKASSESAATLTTAYDAYKAVTLRQPYAGSDAISCRGTGCSGRQSLSSQRRSRLLCNSLLPDGGRVYHVL